MAGGRGTAFEKGRAGEGAVKLAGKGQSNEQWLGRVQGKNY